MNTLLKTPSPLQVVKHPLMEEKNIQLFIKRDDLIHIEISGNKWRKLKHNVLEAKKQRKDTILTFGGTFSNHIAATAAAGYYFGIKTIGIIRGEAENCDNSTLAMAKNQGMELHFITREEYRLKTETSFLKELQKKFPTAFIVPEGGGNKLGALGCAEIIDEIDLDFDYIFSACGTGATLAGLAMGLNEKQQAIGISALKGKDELTPYIQSLLPNSKATNWEVNFDYHFGGFARYSEELVLFINDFKRKTSIQLDPLYTGKMVFGAFDLIQKGMVQNGSKVVLLHTGGLQGIVGFNNRYRTKKVIISYAN